MENGGMAQAPVRNPIPDLEASAEVRAFHSNRPNTFLTR